MNAENVKPPVLDTIVTQLVPTKPDMEAAKELKERIAEAVQPLLVELAAARKMGFQVNFALSDDAFGRPALSVLKVMKEF